MIIKIFPQTEKSAQFPGVSYNTDKVDKLKGELLKVANFGPLQALQHLRPEDYRNYLKMVSATNKAVKYPQFHAVISAKGREYDKQALADIAEQWLTVMGYGEQPYLMVYHKDTGHNHVHLVSTRVNKQGKKISDRFERIRAVQQLNIILGIDEMHSAKADMDKALSYQFGTKAQFMMILECQDYVLKEEDGKLIVIKFGKRQGKIELRILDDRIKEYAPREDRKVQLKALFHKYASAYDTAVERKHGKYTSAFAACLKEKFGVDLLFHASGDKPPYGYTIIDHAERQVFKGGEIMGLKELLALEKDAARTGARDTFTKEVVPAAGEPDEKQLEYYAAILKAAIHNYPDLLQGLHHLGLTISRRGEEYYMGDPGNGVLIHTAVLLDEKDERLLIKLLGQCGELDEEVHRQHVYVPEPYIAPDVDDEAIHGRNRRRKRTARTNQR